MAIKQNMGKAVAERDFPIATVNENALVNAPSGEIDVKSRILTVRGVHVMTDRDLAELYGVDVKRLNEQVKRNAERFPSDFMFQLSKEECLRSQIATLNEARGKHLKYMPYAFTESGIAMLSGVLRSPTAVEVNIRIMRAFVAMRHALASLAPLLARVEANERRQILDQAKNDANQLHNEERFKLILDAMQDKSFPPQKIFFDGQFYDAFAQMKKFIRSAKKELIIIDPYFADSVLPILAQKRPGVRVTVVNCPRGARLLHAVDVNQFNQQYANTLTVKTSDKFHDRFLIIDNAVIIHVGASLNYLGKKCFACSTFDSSNIPEMLTKLPK